jgi:dihydrofolate reductase
MPTVTLEITMSLDGFVAGPNVSIANPMGDGGEKLHDWLFGARSAVDAEIIANMYRTIGAVVLGRRTFDLGEGPWGDEPPFPVPCFVVTHRGRPTLIKSGTPMTFVEDGIESALAQAKEAAGDKTVIIMGGASIAQQYIRAGLVEELDIHMAHQLLGGGSRLFENTGAIELQKVEVVESTDVTHLKFRVSQESSL